MNDMDNYNELQSKINSIESELIKAKLELESSKRDDFKQEVHEFIEMAIEEQEVAGMELTFDLRDDLRFVQTLIDEYLEEGDTDGYSLSKIYFNSLKEKYKAVQEKVKELSTARGTLESVIKVMRNERSVRDKKEVQNNFGIAPEVAEI